MLLNYFPRDWNPRYRAVICVPQRKENIKGGIGGGRDKVEEGLEKSGGMVAQL